MGVLPLSSFSGFNIGIKPYFFDSEDYFYFYILVPNLLFYLFLAVISARRTHWLRGLILRVWGSLQMGLLPY